MISEPNPSLPDVWDTPESAFPASGTEHQQLAFLLNYAVMAPSSHNCQPWLFHLEDGRLDLFADRTRRLPVVDPADRELTMSCGAALLNLRIALRHFGYEDQVERHPDPSSQDHLARLTIGPRRTVSPADRDLFHAIPKRATNRRPFESREVPVDSLHALEEAARAEGAWLTVASSMVDREALADLIAEGDRIQMYDDRFRREVAAWVHPNRAAYRDGMPGYYRGIGDLLSYVGPLIIRTFDIGNWQAARNRDIAVGSPVLAVLGTPNDTSSAWLRAGEALERVLLHARVHGLWASFLNQPVQVDELRPRLRNLLGYDGYPQVILRLGFGPDPRHTPRRTVDDVLF